MPTRRLFLDTVPDNFDPELDIAIGPSCFVGREHIWPEWDRHSFDDPLADSDIQWRDWMRTRILANRMSRMIGQDLNRRHGTYYGPRYWRELTLLWLLLLIQSAWLRYLQINRAIERWGNETLTVPVAAGIGEWRFLDDLDFFHNGPKNPDYDLWIGTLLLQAGAPKTWSLVPVRDVGFRTTSSEIPTELPQGFVKRVLSALLPRRAVYNLTDAGKAEWLLSILVLFFPRHRQDLPPLVDELPDAQVWPPFPDEFLALLDVLIAQTMPKTLTENFAEYDRKASQLGYRAGRLFISGASKYVPKTRFMTAHAIEKGERVVRYQHGAFYGSAHIMIGHEIEYYDHAFISWGWRHDNRLPRPAIALPAPGLSRLRECHDRKTEDLIFIGTNVELGPYPFKPGPQSSGYLKYRRRKIDLINALTPESRSRLKYRPYMKTHSDLDDLDYVARWTGPIPVITGDLDPSLFGCSLAIIDHPGTAMYKALVANVPTLLVWDRAAWPMHSRGNRELDGLERAGIFNDSPISAAQRINTLVGHIDKWWFSEKVQRARSAWCAENAISRKIWVWPWLRYIASAQ